MNRFTISENAEGEFVLRVFGRTVCRCFSYDDAIKAYEEYLILKEAERQNRSNAIGDVFVNAGEFSG